MSTKATNNKTTNKVTSKVQEEKLQVQEEVQEEVQEFEEITAKILKVMTPEGTDERISFVLDKEFDTIDFKTGEVKRTNIFGMNIYAVVNQVSQFIPQIQLADALALGKMVNPQIISLSMTDADVKIKRENHSEGEKRRNGTEVYARDCMTTDFINVKPNIKPLFLQTINQLIATKPAIVKETTQAIPNPFGM